MNKRIKAFQKWLLDMATIPLVLPIVGVVIYAICLPIFGWVMAFFVSCVFLFLVFWICCMFLKG